MSGFFYIDSLYWGGKSPGSLVRKKTLILLISLFSLLLAFRLGQHPLIRFGVKSYLEMRPGGGRVIGFSYETSDWAEGRLILRDVILEIGGGEEDPGLNVATKDLRIALDFTLFPFKFSPKIIIDHPHISLIGEEGERKRQQRGAYELLDKYFFNLPVKMKEGVIDFGDRVVVVTFINPEGGEKGLLKIGKKDEKTAFVATFSKDDRNLRFDLNFEDLDLVWAFKIGRLFVPRINDLVAVTKGTLKGTFSLSYGPPHLVDCVECDLTVSDFALHHRKYDVSVGVHRCSWTKHFGSKEEMGRFGSPPFFQSISPRLFGDGEIVGMEVSIRDRSSNREWNFVDIDGSLRSGQIDTSTMEFHGNYHGENEATPFHLVGKRKIENETFWQMTFDSDIFSNDEVLGYLALTSKGNRRFLVEVDCQNLASHQLGLFKHFASASLPILDRLSIEGGSFNGKGSGWIEEKKLTRLELSSMQASDVRISLPAENIRWQAKDIAGKGAFDLSNPDRYDGTCWELSVSEGKIGYGERGALDKVNLFLAMDDRYVKPSTLECDYQGVRGKATFEGLYTDLTIDIGAFLSSENLADLLDVKKDRRFSDPLALDLTLKLKTVDQSLAVDGNLAFIDEKKGADAIAFGSRWDLEALREKKFRKALELGWFKGEKISDRTVNLPLIFWNKEFRAEGEIGIEGTFNSHALEFTLDPTGVKYRSDEIDVDPRIQGNEKSPNCMFCYDFDQGFWRGKIPLKRVRLRQHSFGIEFDAFTSEVDLEGATLLFQNVDTIADDVRFQGEVTVDFGLADRKELTVNTYAIEGQAQGAVAFLNRFEMFKGLHLPLSGRVIGGLGDMHLHAYIGEVEELLEWKIALRFKEGSYPFSSSIGFDDLAGELYYSASEKRLIVEKFAGKLVLTTGAFPRSYELNVPLLEIDAQEGTLIYDCRLESSTHQICRLVGSGARGCDEFALTFDRDLTSFYGALIDVKVLTFKAGRLNRARLETRLSALDLMHHLDFLSFAGIVPMKSETLDEIRGPSVEGDLALKLDYDFPAKTLFFDARSQYLALGSIVLDHLAICGNRQGDRFDLERFEIGALSILAEMKKKGSKWEIPNLEVIWNKSFLKATQGFFNQEAKTLTLPLERLGLDLGEVKNLFPRSPFDRDYLCGTLFATGEILFDFSKGFQQWFFDSHINLIGEEFSRAKLRFESCEALNIAYHPFSGVKIGKADFHFLHTRSDQLWAKCHFDALGYSKETLEGKGVKMIVPPEMLSFLGQTHSLPYLGYEEERLIVLGHPIRWDNQTDALFDFSLGEKKEMRGSLKEGYYWIGDKARYLNDFSFDLEDGKLELHLNTPFDKTPFDICATLSFHDRFRSRFELKELTEEGQKQPPLVIATDWNRDQGFFIRTIEGGICGLDFSFHHNPKNSFTDQMVLAGQLKIDMSRFTELLPKKMQQTIRRFAMGKGYELSGDLVLSKISLEQSRFTGYLKGKNFRLMGSVMQTLLSDIHIRPDRIELNRLNLSDASGMFSIETVRLMQNDRKEWEVTVPVVTVTDFRPSLLNKIGQYPTPIKPLTIRNLRCYNIRGILGAVKSFTGKGALQFINTFKRDYHILDIPFEILGRLGLDMGLLVPVRGDLEFILIDGRVYLTRLKESYSEGKRSQFFLSPVERSYLDFEGNLNMNIKMKQSVLIKVTEPFTLYIGGTFENPKYGLR
ncbi:MAG: hypothetical protein AAGE99_00400 [Chlamydiota bacterium]